MNQDPNICIAPRAKAGRQVTCSRRESSSCSLTSQRVPSPPYHNQEEGKEEERKELATRAQRRFASAGPSGDKAAVGAARIARVAKRQPMAPACERRWFQKAAAPKVKGWLAANQRGAAPALLGLRGCRLAGASVSGAKKGAAAAVAVAVAATAAVVDISFLFSPLLRDAVRCWALYRSFVIVQAWFALLPCFCIVCAGAFARVEVKVALLLLSSPPSHPLAHSPTHPLTHSLTHSLRLPPNITRRHCVAARRVPV
jgi:hypothetical protein